MLKFKNNIKFIIFFLSYEREVKNNKNYAKHTPTMFASFTVCTNNHYGEYVTKKHAI